MPSAPRTCLQCKNRRVGKDKCHHGYFQDKSIMPGGATEWASGCQHFTQEETPMKELKVRKDKVMALAEKGCQFKEAMETLWPEEFGEKPMVGRVGNIYKRNDELFLLARVKGSQYNLFVLADGNVWSESFSSTPDGKISLPKSFIMGAHVELMTGRIILER